MQYEELIDYHKRALQVQHKEDKDPSEDINQIPSICHWSVFGFGRWPGNNMLFHGFPSYQWLTKKNTKSRNRMSSVLTSCPIEIEKKKT